MELRQLRYFIVAAEEEHFRRAAKRLHIAQPALSRQIALLEKELGCVLFERESHRVRLSALGTQFLADARRITADADRSVDLLRQASMGSTGRLRVGVRETATRSLEVLTALENFRASNPGVELSFHQMASPSQCDAIRQRDLDAGFVYLSDRYDHALERMVIGEHHFYLALPDQHALTARPRLALRDLDELPFVLLPAEENAHYTARLLNVCRQRGLDPRVVHHADSFEAIYTLVSVGSAISFVVSVDGSSPYPGVTLRRLADLSETLTLAMVWRTGFVTPALDGLVNALSRAVEPSRRPSGSQLSAATE